MMWSFVKNEVSFLPKKYKDIKLEFDKVYRGTKSIISRQVICSNYVTDSMEYAVGRLYISKHFDHHSKAAVIYHFII
jgi:predicted metalloendopeptidase